MMYVYVSLKKNNLFFFYIQNLSCNALKASYCRNSDVSSEPPGVVRERLKLGGLFTCSLRLPCRLALCCSLKKSSNGSFVSFSKYASILLMWSKMSLFNASLKRVTLP